MGKFIDMTGWVMSEHGVPDSRLTVLSRADDHISESGNHSIVWNCICQCGESCIAYGQSLKRGTTLSCGCYNREKTHERFFQDLIGQKFGRLLVVSRAEDYVSLCGNTETRWKCKCDCGNECIVNGDNLKNGRTQSCGCLWTEIMKDIPREHNEYKHMDGYYIGYYKNVDKTFYFDEEDASLIQKYYWYCDTKGYARTCVDGKFPSMHEMLGYKEYDHENRNGSDNRKSNLRKCTRSQNQMNRTKQINNKSGFIGVYWNNRNKKWVATVYVDKKAKYLGGFDKINDAVIARLKAEAQYYGKFAPQRHLFEQYGIEMSNQEES